MLKNVAGQKWRVFAFELSTGAPFTGDSANITANLTLDYGTPASTSDVNPTEDPDAGGFYWFDLTQAETAADHAAINPVSSTPGVQVIADPPSVITEVRPSSGAGASQHVVCVDIGGTPLAGAGVWITTDVAGANVVAGTLYTDVLGRAEFMLDPGSYYQWVQKPGYNFTNPSSITVA